MVKIYLEWVTSPEQGKSSGRVPNFSLWTGMFRDGISSIPAESYTAVTRSSFPRLWEQGIPREDENNCWVGEAIVLTITTPYTQLAQGIMGNLWRDYWIRETGTGQQVAQLHKRYTMMVIKSHLPFAGIIR